MSQYPPPYPPSPYVQPPIDFSHYQPPDLLVAARKAGLLVIVLGVLFALFGACNGGQALIMSPEDMAAQQAELQKAGFPAESSFSPQAIRIMNGISGTLILLLGLALIVDGVYVRRGSGVATITGLILTGFLGVITGGLVLVFFIAAFAMPLIAGLGCMFTVPLGLMVWAFVLLIAAARQRPQLAAAQQHYQAQFYHHQQQQQQPFGYAGGYGASHPQTGYGHPAYTAPAAGAMSPGAAPPKPPDSLPPARDPDAPPADPPSPIA